jgi:hypothetical protein
MDVATWNVLHDGRVIAAEGSVPGDLRLSIEIEYLCRHLPTQAEHLVVTLLGCERFEHQPYEQPTRAGPTDIAAFHLELLTAGAGLDGDCINIECADGGYGGQLRALKRTRYWRLSKRTTTAVLTPFGEYRVPL